MVALNENANMIHVIFMIAYYWMNYCTLLLKNAKLLGRTKCSAVNNLNESKNNFDGVVPVIPV